MMISTLRMKNVRGGSRLVLSSLQRRSSSSVGRGWNGGAKRILGGALSSQLQQQCCYYNTEKIVELRSQQHADSNKNKKQLLPKTLYDSTNETENCGVGLIASLKSVPSHDIVQKADEMLVRMAHRGGCGCDPHSGDGAGKNSVVMRSLLMLCLLWK